MSPNTKKISPSDPSEWMSHAESDLKLARLAAKDPDVRREQACFHAQQAAERSIKAVLLLNHVDFPLIHDIEELLKIAEDSGLDLPAAVFQASLLTPYAVEARYPGYWEEITDIDVEEALRIAGQTVSWAKAILRDGFKE